MVPKEAYADSPGDCARDVGESDCQSRHIPRRAAWRGACCSLPPGPLRIDPSASADRARAALAVAAGPAAGALAIDVAGLGFPNPLGMAAGFDKDAEVPDQLLGLGFGFAEVGSITPRPQAGNPRPRLFRLVEDRAVINRMGFNNGGAEVARDRLVRRAGRQITSAPTRTAKSNRRLCCRHEISSPSPDCGPCRTGGLPVC